MNDLSEKRKARYLRDGVPVRLGNLASNLARLASFAQQDALGDAAARVVHESRMFIEWTVADAGTEAQTALRELDGVLAQWQRDWLALWSDRARRFTMRAHADDWARKLLALSGLLKQS